MTNADPLAATRLTKEELKDYLRDPAWPLVSHELVAGFARRKALEAVMPLLKRLNASTDWDELMKAEREARAMIDAWERETKENDDVRPSDA